MELKLDNRQCVIGIMVVVWGLGLLVAYNKGKVQGAKQMEDYVICNRDSGVCQHVQLNHDQIQDTLTRMN